MIDQELFELCKEVYERTGWDDKSAKRRFVTREIVDDADLGGNTASFYTSDYLLEKLPREIPRDENSYFYAELYLTPTVGDAWNAGYRVGASFPDYGCSMDTPLKALLKLVIALDDAGELQRG